MDYIGYAYFSGQEEDIWNQPFFQYYIIGKKREGGSERKGRGNKPDGRD